MTGCALQCPTGGSKSLASKYKISHLRTQPRLNYVLWLHDILSHTSSQERPPTSICGIDVYSSNFLFPMLHSDHVSYPPPAGQAPPPSTHYLPAASRPIGASLQLVSLVSFSTLLTPSFEWLDVDTVSLASAEANIDRNGLSEQISVLRADPAGPILFPMAQDPAASCATRPCPIIFCGLPGTRVDSTSACATHHSMLARRKL